MSQFSSLSDPLFDLKQFEDKVYAFVTNEVNEAFSKLLKANDSTLLQVEGIKIQKAIMRALHFITEENVAQISHGLYFNRMKMTN